MAEESFWLRNADIVFADDLQDRKKIGDAENLANAPADVGEFEFAFGGACRHIETDERAEAAAVYVSEFLEIEDDLFAFGKERADFAVEKISSAGYEFAVAVHDSDVGRSLNF